MNPSYLLLLPGLDGANPLGFLAALGAWRMTDRIYFGTQLSWRIAGGHWAPTLHLPSEVSIFSALRNFSKELKNRPDCIFNLEKNLNVDPNEFKLTSNALVFDNPDFEALAWMSSIGSEIITNVPLGKKKSQIDVTKFRLLSGSGRQDFIPTVQAILNTTTLRQCVNSVLRPWTYEDKKIGLRWDPLEEKRYALRWKDPSPDPTMTQRGANRLAIEALPLLLTAPIGNRLETTGFTGHRSNNTFWTWPIWETPISLDTGRSLIALSDLQEATPKSDSLNQRGIAAVFRSQRITTGKFRNFTPAVQVN